MVVDDNEDITMTLEMILKKMNHAVTVCHNGAEFLKSVESVSPTLVLLDIMMPGLSTPEILDKLEGMSNTGSIKVIMITAARFSDEERAAFTERKNVVDFVLKPFDTFKLMDCISSHLK